MNFPRRSVALPWLGLILVALLATWIRYELIEPRRIAQFCSARNSPLWCSWRQTLVMGFLDNVYGCAALAAAALALVFRRHLALAWLAAALGIFALQLYCFETGALALLVGCLRLVRLQAPPHLPPFKTHRRGQQQIQQQP